MMKAINVFLLLLIIIGLGAFATQGIWVPKLVARIIASETTPPTLIELPKYPERLKQGKHCYSYSHKATVDSPYNVKEVLSIELTGTNVKGEKTGTQNGPDMNNGYTGEVLGTLNNNNLNLIFSYIVEGSSNKEKEIYEITKTGLDRLRYPLVEEEGILVPDMTKEFKILAYYKTTCEE